MEFLNQEIYYKVVGSTNELIVARYAFNELNRVWAVSLNREGNVIVNNLINSNLNNLKKEVLNYINDLRLKVTNIKDF